jgi:hypothetical protein
MTITVKPGETVTIVGVQADSPLPPIIPPQQPVDPGYSPPWAQVPPRPTHPIVDVPPPTAPPPQDSGHWVWAWSPQLNRWIWVRIPGSGESGPK